MNHDGRERQGGRREQGIKENNPLWRETYLPSSLVMDGPGRCFLPRVSGALWVSVLREAPQRPFLCGCSRVPWPLLVVCVVRDHPLFSSTFPRPPHPGPWARGPSLMGPCPQMHNVWCHSLGALSLSLVSHQPHAPWPWPHAYLSSMCSRPHAPLIPSLSPPRILLVHHHAAHAPSPPPPPKA